MSKKGNKLFIAFDIIELLLVLAGFFVFTFAFCLITSEVKYAFLLADIYGIYVFVKTADDLAKNIKELVIAK